MSVTHLTAHPSRRPVPVFRGRIGRDARSGHYAVPRRYRIHLSTACPGGLRIAVAHRLLALDDICPVTFLPAVPDGPDGGHTVLRPLYEASMHHYSGPALEPVLSDDWSGRIVSTHAPDIMRDLARHFGDGRADLYPCGAESVVQAVERLCSEGIDGAAQRAGRPDATPAERAAAVDELDAALASAEQLVAAGPHVTGQAPTAADIELWTALVRLDTVHRNHLDADAVRRAAAHRALWDYARSLTAHPAFGAHLDLAGIDRRHRAGCRGLEAAGAAVRILDWAAYAGSSPSRDTRPDGC